MEGLLRRSPCRVIALAVTLLTTLASVARAADLAETTLFDGERSELVNNWGGIWHADTAKSVFLQTDCVHSGHHALSFELGTLDAGQERVLQCPASALGRTLAHRQTRNLARYRKLSFFAHNATRVELRGFVQVRDGQDNPAHRAVFRFALPEAPQWSCVEVPLALQTAGWEVHGKPDLTQVTALDFAFAPRKPLAGGRVSIDDVTLTEASGSADLAKASVPAMCQQLAQRQFDAMWSARSRVHGLIPNTSYQSSDAGLNTTSTVLWTLPAAVRHGWVSPAAADDYVALLVQTFTRLMDHSKYLPPRNVDWVTLERSLMPEESTVDTAFLALALHQYKSLPSTPPALRNAIDQLQERFNFAAFVSPAGWRMAYRYENRWGHEGMLECTYDGYTNESAVISLAAHLARRYHVPIETYWNTNVHRVRIQLTGLDRSPVVHTAKEFRAPFTQALLNLFIDVRQRGVDTYPDHGLAANPWQNFVSYEQWVMARLADMGRRNFVQPDAGDDGSLKNYQQFSLYENFGQTDLFMPWSSTFAVLAGADGAGEALRFLLQHNLHGPLGLSDSCKWTTGADEPYAVTARHDFWNTGLATMALLETLDGEYRQSKFFANLGDVREALDHVFPAAIPATQVNNSAKSKVEVVRADRS